MFEIVARLSGVLLLPLVGASAGVLFGVYGACMDDQSTWPCLCSGGLLGVALLSEGLIPLFQCLKPLRASVPQW